MVPACQRDTGTGLVESASDPARGPRSSAPDPAPDCAAPGGRRLFSDASGPVTLTWLGSPALGRTPSRMTRTAPNCQIAVLAPR